MSPDGVARLAERIVEGDRLALARGLTRVERGTDEGIALVSELFGRTGRAIRLGLTGPPGAGKSTLASSLIRALRAKGKSVAVVAVDPSSAFTGGAILGDRVRMQEFATDDGVFIRSMATRGLLGGLARATLDAVDLLDAAGFDVIMIETVGVGQSEIDVATAADLTLVIISPESGDGVQALKAGLMEIADVFVINKSDREGAERTERAILNAQEVATARGPEDAPPILRTSAEKGTGVPELLELVLATHARFLEEGELSNVRRKGLATQLRRLLEDRLSGMFHEEESLARAFDADVARLEAREFSPHEAATRLLEAFFEQRGAPVTGSAPTT